MPVGLGWRPVVFQRPFGQGGTLMFRHRTPRDRRRSMVASPRSIIAAPTSALIASDGRKRSELT